MKKTNTDSAGIYQIKWSLTRRHVCFCNPFPQTESHQQKRAQNLCSATLKRDPAYIFLQFLNVYFSGVYMSQYLFVNIVKII